MSSQTETVASFVASLDYKNIPTNIVNNLKASILDTLGSGIYGSTLSWVRSFSDLVMNWKGNGEASVWGRGRKLPSMNAAFINGTMAHAFELDDAHRNSVTHPGTVVIPAVLAMAELKGNVDGKTFLTAVTAGYEVMCRVGIALGVSHRLRGFHPTGTCGVFGSASGAAKILGLDEERTICALSIAGTEASGLYNPSLVKRLNAGRAAQTGIMAALLAQSGLSGTKDVLEAPHGGFCRGFSDNPDIGRLVTDLGKSFEAGNVSLKPYSCDAGNCRTIDAVKKAIEGHEIAPESIEKIVVKTSTQNKEFSYGFKVDSVSSAMMSLPYCVAVFLIEKNAFLDQFTEKKIRDSNILSLSKRVEVMADPEIDRQMMSDPTRPVNVHVEIKLTDGKSFSSSVMHSKGSPMNPMSPREIRDKFTKLASYVLDKNKIEFIISTVEDLEELSCVDQIVPE